MAHRLRMDRRQFLATAGTATGVLTAGCLGTEDTIETNRVNASGTDSRNQLASGEIASFNGRRVRFTVTELQRSVVVTTEEMTVLEPPVGQFLVAELETSAIDLETPSAVFRLAIDGHVPEPPGDVPSSVFLSERRERLAFWVPNIEAGAGEIQFLNAYRPSWAVPGALVERFGTAPSFHLVDAGMSRSGAQTTLDLRVENRGHRGGVFRAVTHAPSGNEAERVLFTVNTEETLSASVRNDVVTEWPSTIGFSHSITPETREFTPATDA